MKGDVHSKISVATKAVVNTPRLQKALITKFVEEKILFNTSIEMHLYLSVLILCCAVVLSIFADLNTRGILS